MSSAFDRNKDPILNVLKQLIKVTNYKKRLFILEVASGYGQHITYFADNIDNTAWQPSEGDKTCISYMTNVLKKIDPTNFKIMRPVYLDVSKEPKHWLSNLEEECFDFVLCINMTHISNIKATEGLFNGAGFYLKPGGALIIYGPFIVYGDFVHQNNTDFDKYLRTKNPEWGLREIHDLCKLGEGVGLFLEKIVDMPANNKTLIFRKQRSVP